MRPFSRSICRGSRRRRRIPRKDAGRPQTRQKNAFPWGKVVPKGPDEGRDAVSFLRVGAGHAAAPTPIHPTAYRPSSVSANAEPPSPRGRLFSSSPGGFRKVVDYTPSVMGFWPMTAPPTQGSQRHAGGFFRNTGHFPQMGIKNPRKHFCFREFYT